MEKQNEWEYNAAIAMFSLINYNNIEKELLIEYCVYHLIDVFLYNEKIEILKIITSKEENPDTFDKTLFKYICYILI